MKKFLIMIIIIICFTSLSAKGKIEAEVKRDRAIVRKGPASFFEIISEMRKGDIFTILDEEDGWFEITYADNMGFVSQKVTKENKGQEDFFSRMATKPVSLQISQHGMSAGVKGFAERFSRKFDGDLSFSEILEKYSFSQKEYEKFRKKTYKGFNLKKNRKKIHLPDYSGKEYFSFSEEGIGIGIASKIASIGLYRNRNIQDYINFVGNIIVESTDAYDIGFKFFILDTNKVNAYACPGGIIFITKGMLKQIDSEAELAFVLAHEIAHVARHHGMLELEERKQQVMADDAFMDMEKEMDEIGGGFDEEIGDVEAEMEDLAVQFYDTIFNGRLEQYEEEADHLGLLYTARAGYNAREALALLNRLYLIESQSTNEHYTYQQIRKRISIMKNNPYHLSLPKKLFNHKARWKEAAIFID
ncbi:MAG TPA: toxin-antitoxin system, toxin component [Candidatus Cloacimonetes bacterium]|nr:toxin-antitoxin system, toxin component [Candidatus Cloacimonadota bacterium]